MWLEQELNFPKLCFVYIKGNFKHINLFQSFKIVLLSSKNLPWLFNIIFNTNVVGQNCVVSKKKNIINDLWRPPVLWYNPIIYLT